ncbi:MAG: hypothetical protein ACYS71_00545 [Planctomycetota bacterium]|jgi:hypothetical protein
MKRHFSLNTCLLVLLAMCWLLVPSCKKAPKEDQPTKTQQQDVTVTTDVGTNIETPVDLTVKMVPIDLKLPKPLFVGTPANIRGVTNIEKPLGRMQRGHRRQLCRAGHLGAKRHY